MKFCKLIFVIFAFFFLGCATSNSVAQKSVDRSYEKKVVTTKSAKETKSVVKKAFSRGLKKKRLKSAVEVARVCFDKRGVAHNCNYKIKKPYGVIQDLPYLN